jgi:amylovoran biosynthesis glycosyltransferase AmsD
LNKPSLVFICSRLDLPGGTEKAVVNTANLLQSEGHVVSLLILDEPGSIFFPLTSSIAVYSANLHFGITKKGNVLTRKLAFRKHVKQLGKLLVQINADVVIATEYHFAIASRLSAAATTSKIYSWEHHHFKELDKSRFWKFLLRGTYPKLDGVICLNQDEAQLFSGIGARTFVIPNFIAPHENTSGKNKIITVARLSHVKGIDLLLEIAPAILKKQPHWRWTIIGDGEMREAVLERVASEGLSEQLELKQPYSPDLSTDYGTSAIYVMTSRNECFPMVLLEAMSYGIVPIAFDCETGPRHIINNDFDGLLVENGSVEKMIGAIEALINDQERLSQMSDKALSSVRRFSPEKIFDLWTALFQG